MKYLLLFTLAIAFLSCETKTPAAEEESLALIPLDSVRLELERRYDLDQDLRRILVDSIGMDSPEASSFMGKIWKQDQENQAYLVKVLEQHGWLGKSDIGEKANAAIFYIVQHSDVELMDKYFPQLKVLAEKGEANLRHSAMMEDRLLMWKGQKQIYGTQASKEETDTAYYIWPIEKPETVNERRKQAGFQSTVEEYAASMEAIWDPNRALKEEE